MMRVARWGLGAMTVALSGCFPMCGPSVPTVHYIAFSEAAPLSASAIAPDGESGGMPEAIGLDAAGNGVALASTRRKESSSDPSPNGAAVSYRLARFGADGVFRGAVSFPPLDLTALDAVVDGQGRVVVVHANGQLHRWDATGHGEVLAGGQTGRKDGTGLAAAFVHPTVLAQDAEGNVAVIDGDQVRRVTPEGRVTTLALGSALETLFPTALAFGPDGTFYVATSMRVIRVTPGGEVAALAGGEQGDADGPGDRATFNGITGLAVLPSGDVVVADAGNFSLRRVTPEGVVSTFATGVTDDYQGMSRLAVRPDGQVLVVDKRRNQILGVSPSGAVTVVAGRKNQVVAGRATTELDGLQGVAVGADGTLVAVVAGRVMKLDAGGGQTPVLPAVDADARMDLAVAADGTAYVSDPVAHAVWRVGVDGAIAPFVAAGPTFPEGDPHRVALEMPMAIALDATRGLVVWDDGPRRLVRVGPEGGLTALRADLGRVVDLAAAPDGALWLVAGTRESAWTGGVKALSPQGGDLPSPYQLPLTVSWGVAVGPDGTPYVASGREVSRLGASTQSVVLTQIDQDAPKRPPGYTVQCTPPWTPPAPTYGALAVDAAGNVLVGNFLGSVIRAAVSTR